MRLTAELTEIDFSPGSVEEEIAQNVRTILATQAGTVPLDRDFGVSWDFIDAPIHVARARVNNEIARKVQRYEPRAAVKKVTYDGRSVETGELLASVEIEVTL